MSRAYGFLVGVVKSRDGMRSPRQLLPCAAIVSTLAKAAGLVRPRPVAAAPPRMRTLGALAAGALLIPLLGKSFSVYFPVHPRIVSLVLTGAAVALALLYRQFAPGSSRTVVALQFTWALLFFAILWSADWGDTLFLVVNRPTIGQYPAFKFTRIVVVAVPIAAMAAVVARLASHTLFEQGIRRATVFIGAAALALFILQFDALTAPALLAGGGNEVLFSTISLSIVFLHVQGVTTAWYLQRPSLARLPWILGVSLGCFFAYYILSQRTALLLNIVFVAIVLYRLAPGRLTGGLLAFVGIYAAYTTFLSLLFGGSDLTRVVQQYVSQYGRLTSVLDLDNRSWTVRSDMFGYCMRHGLDELWGHGLGSFPTYFGRLYPHNVLAEAFFELGIFGLLSVGFLSAATVVVGARLFVAGSSDLAFLMLTVTFVYSLKSGNLASAGQWAFWLFIAAGALLEPADAERPRRSDKRTVAASGALPRLRPRSS